MNNSTASVNPNLQYVPYYNAYIAVGSTSCLVNMALFLILMSEKHLRKSSVYMLGLCSSDTLNGLALAATGFYRLYVIYYLPIGAVVQASSCFIRLTTLWTIGAQFPSMMILAGGLDRIIAIVFYKWYFTNWKANYCYIVVAVSTAITALSTGAGWSVLIYSPGRLVPVACVTPIVMGLPYSIYHYLQAAFCAIFSSISAGLASYLIFKKNKQRTENSIYSINQAKPLTTSIKNRIKAENDWCKVMICLSICDLAFVAIPNLLILISAIKPELMTPDNFIFYGIGLRGALVINLRSMLNFGIYLAFKASFKKAILKLLRLQHLFNRVTTITSTGGQ